MNPAVISVSTFTLFIWINVVLYCCCFVLFFSHSGPQSNIILVRFIIVFLFFSAVFHCKCQDTIITVITEGSLNKRKLNWHKVPCLPSEDRSACASAQSYRNLRCTPEDAPGPWIPTECPARTLIRLRASTLSPLVCFITMSLIICVSQMRQRTTMRTVEPR